MPEPTENVKRFKSFTRRMTFWESVWHLITQFEWKTHHVLYYEVYPNDPAYGEAPFEVNYIFHSEQFIIRRK